MTVSLNGRLLKDSEATISIDDAGFLFGHGAFETLRTYEGQPKYVDEHFDRLADSAKALNIQLPYIKQKLASMLTRLLKVRRAETSSKEFRIRLTLSAGAANFMQAKSGKPVLLITAKELIEPSAQPLSVITCAIERIIPKVKSTSLLPNILARQQATAAGAREAILVDRAGQVREGTFSNIFVVKKGTLYTPQADILPGVTRGVVMQLARAILPLQTREIKKQQLLSADEVFVTSSVLGVAPVGSIDGKVLPKQRPWTAKLRRAYLDKLAEAD